MSDDLLSLKDLRAALDARHVSLTDRQLKRLRREGLLLCEEQGHRPGLRGSESLYPQWSVGQLELVSRLARKERRFVQLRILVRWHDGWVEPELLRSSFAELLERVSAQARRLAAGPGDDGDKADRLARAMTEPAGRSGLSRLIRSRLGHATLDAERVAYAFAALAVRADIEWDNHDPADPVEPLRLVFDRASGFERARRDSIAGNAPILSNDESTPAILTELQEAGCFDLLDLGRAFREADDNAIDQAFADAHLLGGLAPVFDAIQAIEGEDIAGLASLTEMLGGELDGWAVAMIVRGCLVLRPIVPEDALESIAQAAEKARPAIEAAVQIRRDLPQYADLLDADFSERLAALDPTEADRVRVALSAYLEEHPELATALDDGKQVA